MEVIGVVRMRSGEVETIEVDEDSRGSSNNPACDELPTSGAVIEQKYSHGPDQQPFKRREAASNSSHDCSEEGWPAKSRSVDEEHDNGEGADL